MTASGWGSATAPFPYLISPLSAIQEHTRREKIAIDWHLDNQNLERGALIAKASQVAIVFISASSGEAHIHVDGNKGDRKNLLAWDDGDALVTAVADANENTIVVIHAVRPSLSLRKLSYGYICRSVQYSSRSGSTIRM